MNPEGAVREQLTPSELTLVREVAGGYSNKEIAAHLHTTERAIEARTAALRKKCCVGNRTELAIMALREGWVSLDNVWEELLPRIEARASELLYRY